MVFSDEARLMVRPFRTYAALGRDAADGGWDGRLLAGKIAFLQLSLGAFVSFTAAGRLVAVHVALTALFWAFVPLLQIAAIALTLRVVTPRTPLVRALGLYFAGHGPWLALLLLVSAICLFAPDVYVAMTKLVASRALPALFVVALVWGGVLTWAVFRHGLALARARAAAATAVFYVVYVGAIVAYYFFADQLRANFFWRPLP